MENTEKILKDLTANLKELQKVNESNFHNSINDLKKEGKTKEADSFLEQHRKVNKLILNKDTAGLNNILAELKNTIQQ